MLGIVNPLISARNNKIYIDVVFEDVLISHWRIFMGFEQIRLLVNSLTMLWTFHYTRWIHFILWFIYPPTK